MCTTSTFSAEELAVLRHLPTQQSFDQIGEQLQLPRAIVRTVAITIYRKMGVVTRADAVQKALVLGLIPRQRNE